MFYLCEVAKWAWLTNLRPEVEIEHEDGDEDGEGDKNHGEEQVLANERYNDGGRRDAFSEEEEENGEREEDGYTQADLLATVTGQVEDKHCEE